MVGLSLSFLIGGWIVTKTADPYCDVGRCKVFIPLFVVDAALWLVAAVGMFRYHSASQRDDDDDSLALGNPGDGVVITEVGVKDDGDENNDTHRTEEEGGAS